MLPSGLTRSSVQRNHAFIAPDSHVTSTLPGWTATKGIVLISPQMGARFTQYYALMEKGSKLGAPQPGIQRFLYVLEGELRFRQGAAAHTLTSGCYAYLPPDTAHEGSTDAPAKLMIFEKPYCGWEGAPKPPVVIGDQAKIASAPFLGDDAAQLKLLLPEVPGFDMAVNIFAFQPGTTLPFVEVHVMEHGLLLLQGGGVYRLDDRWYPITAGDVLWMAPYCPQWWVAAGKTPSAYLYYKDIQRDPLTML